VTSARTSTWFGTDNGIGSDVAGGPGGTFDADAPADDAPGRVVAGAPDVVGADVLRWNPAQPLNAMTVDTPTADMTSPIRPMSVSYSCRD
jgi:hypothetical protein